MYRGGRGSLPDLHQRLWFDLKVYGIGIRSARGGVLIVSNHQSYLDPSSLGVQAAPAVELPGQERAV